MSSDALFGNCFIYLRNTHILPLIHFGIKEDKHKHWALKDIITNNILSLNSTGSNILEIELSKNDFYNALHCDIELFMNKSTIQYTDFSLSHTNSPSWSFVTLYYFSFFTITCFFRLLRKGYIFLTKEQTKRLEAYSLAVYSAPIALSVGNYYFEYKNETPYGNIIIELKHTGNNLHKSNWDCFEKTLKELEGKCDGDESLIFKSFISHFSHFKTEFPSNLRNKLNYNGESSILDLNNSLTHVDLKTININFIQGLLKIGNDVTNKNQIDSILYLSNYFFKLNNLLYCEYLSRSNFGKDFDKKRIQYLTKSKAKLPFVRN